MKDQETRRRVHEFIRTHPGSSARAAQRGVGLAWGEAAYHLHDLLENGKILRQRGGRRDYYFTTDIPAVDRVILLAMQSGIERGILVVLARSEALTFGELVKHVRAGQSTVAFHLKFLTASGLVQANPGPERGLKYRVLQPDLILRVYDSFKDSFDDRWVDGFSSTWGGLVRD